MNRRTVLLVIATAFLAAAVIGSTASNGEDQADKPPEQTSAQAAMANAAGDGTLRATLPRDRVVRARLGQVVALTVESDAPESVAAFGQSESVAPSAPVTLTFVADTAGTFPVKLNLSGRTIGKVVVRAAERKEPARAEDSDPATSGGTAPRTR